MVYSYWICLSFLGCPACSRSTWHPGISYWDLSGYLPAMASVEGNWTSTPQPGPRTNQHSVWRFPSLCVCRPGKTHLAQREVHVAEVWRLGQVSSSKDKGALQLPWFGSRPQCGRLDHQQHSGQQWSVILAEIHHSSGFCSECWELEG